ncbi:MAG TPA: aminoglycoside phosphotransferase family protein [Streptosporangiaceae bacterium]|nr:aminoglycoside phosphotransferase family protein [Streptosporangiaceae bacterium]
MTRRVERAGSTVRRPMAFWSPTVHALLRYLESADFPAPRLLGVDGDVEVLTWIEGESGPAAWGKVVPEAGLRAWARFLRRYHDAVAGFRPPAGSAWSSGRAGGCSPGEIVCHGDFGPWNGVWRGGEVAGLVDWDHARPATPLFDVAYGLEYAAPFRDDQECARWLGYPGPPDRRRRIAVFCEAYGMPVPGDVRAAVAGQQRTVAATCEALARRGIEPQATWVRNGYLAQVQARIDWTEGSGL